MSRVQTLQSLLASTGSANLNQRFLAPMSSMNENCLVTTPSRFVAERLSAPGSSARVPATDSDYLLVVVVRSTAQVHRSTL